MKNLLISVLLLVNFISCSNKKTEMTENIFRNEYKELSQKIIDYYFSNMAQKADERTQFIGNSLKKDRDFMLSLFSQDFSASVFSSSTKYTSQKIDYCGIVDNDGNFLSESGINRNFFTADANGFEFINDSLWIIIKYKEENFSALTATLVKNEDFDDLKNVLGKDILVLFNMSLTNSTIKIKNKSIVLNSDTLIIDEGKFASILHSITDKIDVLVLTK